jgi:SAM-dependent methyltransferase
MSETFTYNGVELAYFDHLYNLTYLNERRVELAIAHHWLGQMPWEVQKAGLEVGNVMGHYCQRPHVVYDLNEPAAWYQELAGQQVISQDILDVVAMFAYPWVLSISTIEHTEDPIKALNELYDLIAPGGKMLVTFPTGADPRLDAYVEGLLPVYGGPMRWCTIARTDDDWEQTTEAEIRPYGPWANSVFVGEWERPV